MDGINNNYIEEALNKLIPTLGIKQYIDHNDLIFLINSGKVEECIKEIALYLGLPVEIKISYVSNSYKPNTNDGFQSTHVVKTDWRGMGSSGITAQVQIPSNLPLYGTSSMVGFPINVRLNEKCSENPETLITVVAHEFSHIVLYSMWHIEKENEFYTDLTAMLLGFAEIMKIGRKVTKTKTSTRSGFLSGTKTTHTKITTYGYLSDENFSFAFNKIENLFNQQEVLKKQLVKRLKQFKKQLNKTNKLSFYFKNSLEYLDKNLTKKISQEDGIRISYFHQSEYMDNFQSMIRENKVVLENILKFTENLKNYTEQNTETMQKYEDQLKIASEELLKEHLTLKKDLNILRRYINFFYSLKLRFTK